MSKLPENLIYEPISASDVQAAHAIEILCFPPDEAATLDKFEYRQAQAPDLFLGCFLQDGTKRTLIGYICSTLSRDDSLTHESMSEHDANGTSVCMHAVCVAPAYRRHGVALALLKEYVTRLAQHAAYARVLLITHDDIRGLYEQAGFEWLGASKVVHGSKPWYEMRKVLPSSPTTSTAPSEGAAPEPQALPANINIWEALQRATSSRAVPAATLLSAFPRGLADVAGAQTAGGASSALTNTHDLLCPRPQCGSIILKSKGATLVERESVALEPEGAQSPLLPLLPAPPALVSWWRVTPNAMAFENIGFSRSIASDDGKRLKLLSCAECDLGPLGWCQEGGSEFWLATDRVGYRA